MNRKYEEQARIVDDEYRYRGNMDASNKKS